MLSASRVKLRVLGCSGGIGSGLRTTCLALNQNILIDAGTGLGDLSMLELSLIDHVFLTHAHLDHIAMLPLLVDTAGAMRSQPLVVHALPEVLQVLQQHVFNWQVWPDFTCIPDAEQPFLRFEPLALGQSWSAPGLTLTPLPALHTVPACGYWVDSGRASLVFTGDTTVNDDFWPVVNRIANLRYLLIETAFCNREAPLAVLSKHLAPNMLLQELQKLERKVDLYITHLKPGEIELTMNEVLSEVAAWRPRMLQRNQVLEF